MNNAVVRVVKLFALAEECIHAFQSEIYSLDVGGGAWKCGYKADCCQFWYEVGRCNDSAAGCIGLAVEVECWHEANDEAMDIFLAIGTMEIGQPVT